MATHEPVFPQTIAEENISTIATTDGTDLITILSSLSATDGALIEAIWVSTDNSATRYINLYENDGTTDMPLCYATLNINAGVASTSFPAINLVDYLPSGDFKLVNGRTLKVGLDAVLAADKTVWIRLQYLKY